MYLGGFAADPWRASFLDYLPSGGSPQHAQILNSGRNCNRRCGCQHDGGGTGPRGWVEQGTDHVAERRDVNAKGRWIDRAEGRRIIRAQPIEHQDDRRWPNHDQNEWFGVAWWLEEDSFNVDEHVQWFGLGHHDKHRHDHNNHRADV